MMCGTGIWVFRLKPWISPGIGGTGELARRNRLALGGEPAIGHGPRLDGDGTIRTSAGIAAGVGVVPSSLRGLAPKPANAVPRRGIGIVNAL